MLSKRRYDDPPEVVFDGYTMPPSRGIKYLGVRMGTNGNFSEHIEEAAKKAVSTVAAVARLMPNAGGPSVAKRKILMAVAASKLLYAAPAWTAHAPMTKRSRNSMAGVNRLASLSCIRAYRTVLDETAAFLAGATPLDLLAEERTQLWTNRREGLSMEETEQRAEQIRAATITRWQNCWSMDSGKVAWAKVLLPDVAKWLKSGGTGRLTFHLTQALTGHGCFSTYLHRIKKATSPYC